MKILYVSDLDGTLLKSNDKMSEYTIRTINKLIDNGMYFFMRPPDHYHRHQLLQMV